MYTEVYYTSKEVAKLLKVAYITVFRWIKSGKLKTCKAGKQYRIKKIDFDAFIETR